MARPLRRPRRHDLLARREEIGLHLFATENMLVVRSRGDDRGGATALHGDGRGLAICGQPRPERGGVRLLPPAGVPAVAATERDPPAETVPPGSRENRGVPATATRPVAADQMGLDQPAI